MIKVTIKNNNGVWGVYLDDEKASLGIIKNESAAREKASNVCRRGKYRSLMVLSL